MWHGGNSEGDVLVERPSGGSLLRARSRSESMIREEKAGVSAADEIARDDKATSAHLGCNQYVRSSYEYRPRPIHVLLILSLHPSALNRNVSDEGRRYSFSFSIGTALIQYTGSSTTCRLECFPSRHFHSTMLAFVLCPRVNTLTEPHRL